MTNFFAQIRRQTTYASLVKELSDKIARSQPAIEDDGGNIRMMRVNSDKITYADTDSNLLDGSKTDSDAIAHASTSYDNKRVIAKGAYVFEDSVGSNLEMFLRLEKASSADQSGNGLTVTDGSAITYNGPGAFFDASANSVITVTDNADIRVANNFSISCWGYASAITTDGGLSRRMVSKTDDANNKYNIGVNTSGKIFGNVTKGGVEAVTRTSSTISTGQIFHACFTYNAGTILTYLNGTASNEAANSGNYSAAADLYIGRTSNSTGRWSGYIWGVRYYAKTLSAGEVSAIYNGYSEYGNAGIVNLCECT